jgi:hypothetical protein
MERQLLDIQREHEAVTKEKDKGKQGSLLQFVTPARHNGATLWKGKILGNTALRGGRRWQEGASSLTCGVWCC